MTINTSHNIAPQAHPNAIWYFLKRGAATLSLVYIILASMFLLFNITTILTSGWYGVVLHLYAMSVIVVIVASVILSIIWGFIMRILMIAEISQQGRTVVSGCVLGMWTWRYWTTLEPAKKKKKRG